MKKHTANPYLAIQVEVPTDHVRAIFRKPASIFSLTAPTSETDESTKAPAAAKAFLCALVATLYVQYGQAHHFFLPFFPFFFFLVRGNGLTMRKSPGLGYFLALAIHSCSLGSTIAFSSVPMLIW